MKSRFTVRTTKPTKANKEFVTDDRGGWSGAIEGSPTDPGANVLSNCVGYAQGRLCEAYNEMFGTTGNKYYYLNCNAENFVERAQAKYPELKFSDDPVLGAIMCWRKGGLGSSDGAGHVEFVEKVIDNNTVVTTASNYGGTAFYTSTRKRNSGNGWGLGSPYAFRYFIYNPDMVIKVPLPVDRDEWVDQLEVLDGDYSLRVRSGPTTSSDILGIAKLGYYNILETKDAEDYTWYRVDDAAWIAGVSDLTKFLPKKNYVKPQPVARDEKVNQLQIDIDILRIRIEPNTDCKVMGAFDKGIYNVIQVEQKKDYTWYKLGEYAWAAGVDGVTYLPFTEDPTIKELKEQIAKLTKANEELTKEVQQLTTDLGIAKEEVAAKTKKLEGLKPIANEIKDDTDKLIAEL